jgi:hypothetical protein
MISPLLDIELNQYLHRDLSDEWERFRLHDLASKHSEPILTRLAKTLVWRWKLGHYTYRESDFAEPSAI